STAHASHTSQSRRVRRRKPPLRWSIGRSRSGIHSKEASAPARRRRARSSTAHSSASPTAKSSGFQACMVS
ncbi:50S ribosomal protein L33, partial [Dysosmobacter welbionis]